MSPPQIVVDHLTKSFRVAERHPGALGALTGLVRRRSRTIDALKGISFN
jgi:ABC-2 type transport system ATP-binding protein